MQIQTIMSRKMQKKFSHKKVRITSLMLAVLIFTAACALLTACNKTNQHALDTSPCYDINMEYDMDTATIAATQEILYTASDNLDCIVLHIYANSFAKDNSAIDILSAQIDKQTVEYEIYGEDRTLLKLPCALRKDDSVIMTFKYTVSLAHSDTRLGVTEQGNANLTCFYPVVAKYDGGWREDCYTQFGDPFFCDTSSFYVRLTVDEGLSVATSGKVTDTQYATKGGKDKKILEIEAENIRDFGMAVGKFESLSESVNIGGRKVEVNYFYYSDSEPAESLSRAMKSITVFSEAFGDYPHSTFTVVQSNLASAGGMEYGAFVLVSPTESRADYLDTITHETAHQWWYNAVGSDQLNSAWLDEGLTEFCTYYYYYLVGDRTMFTSAMQSISRSYSAFSALKPTVGFDGRMNRHLTTYLTEGEYVAVTYYKGALLFDTLHTLVGDKKFQAAMKCYFERNKYSIATQAELVSAFKAQGYNMESIVSGWTNDTAPLQFT